MSESEYSVDEIKRVRPEYKRDGRLLFQNGVKVEYWQLTLDEQMQHYPEKFETVGKKKVPCPVPECKQFVDDPDDPESRGKTSLVNHIRVRHGEWYERMKRRLEKCETMADVRALTQGTENST